MTKPTEFGPSLEIEDRHSRNARRLRRRLWALRLLGVLILVSGWLIVAGPELGAPRFILITIVFAAMGVAAFATAITARRVAVNLEKKQRLRLLVHNMELESMATHDGLTQLFNRRYLFDRLERELKAASISDRALSFIMIELNSLKSVNDHYGHRVGDAVLANFGRLLLNYTRATDIPARIGSDEFAIALPDTDKRGASTMVDRISQALSITDLFEDDGASIRLSACFGISGYPWGADTVDKMLQQADAVLIANQQARQPPTDEGVPAAFQESIGDVLDPEASP